MAKRPHVMTPARKAALAKARMAAIRAKRRRHLSRNRGHAPKPANRGIGISGLAKNTVPYVRANKRSQTSGFNAGTIIPGTNKRIVIGGYTRIENTTRHSHIDTILGQVGAKIAPKNSRTRKIADFFRKNVKVTNPAARATLGGAEVRLGTSRGAGPTIIVRRGRHKISQNASMRSIKRFDTHAKKLHARKKKKARPQRRRSSKNG